MTIALPSPRLQDQKEPVGERPAPCGITEARRVRHEEGLLRRDEAGTPPTRSVRGLVQEEGEFPSHGVKGDGTHSRKWRASFLHAAVHLSPQRSFLPSAVQEAALVPSMGTNGISVS